MKKGILVVSFGTTYIETAKKNIETLELQVVETYRDLPIYSAYSSEMVRKILGKRGFFKHSVESALESMKSSGISEVFVLPTHLLYGVEYEKIQRILHEKEADFQSILFGKPLLSHTEDMLEIISILGKKYPNTSDTALLLVGHGSSHYTNAFYPALDYMAKASGYPHIYLSTVEGYPDLSVVLPLLKEKDYKNIHLLPFMLVAGDHAVEDITSSNPDSFYSQLTALGYHVTFDLKGLGEVEEIRGLYLQHLEELFHASE